MSDQKKKSFAGLLVGAAAFIIIVAGLKAAAAFLVPLLLALFIAILAMPPFFALKRWGVPSGLALLALMLVLIAVLTLGTTGLLTSVNVFTNNLPQYQEGLYERLKGPVAWLESRGMGTLDEWINQYLTGKTALTIVRGTAGAVSGLLSQAFIVLLIVLFVLSEAAMFPAKLRAIPGMNQDSMDNLAQALESVRRYMGMKALTSLVTGTCVFILLRFMNVEAATMMGVLAFLLNFVPNVGSIMAAIPGVLLALVLNGGGSALAVGIGYLAINMLIGNFLEPKLMGGRLGLSPLIVVLSLLLWGWVLGPVGMLLSVPLTTTVKILLGSIEETRGIAILLGSSPPEPRRT
jgi:AI-2 transport protein TqsA